MSYGTLYHQNSQNQENRYNVIKTWLKTGTESIPKLHQKDKNKRFELSENSKEIIEKRKTAAAKRNPQLFMTLTKEFNKSRKDDKRNRILESISKDLDLRERWLGIRELKKKYTPTPFHNKDKYGIHIQYKRRAQYAAK